MYLAIKKKDWLQTVKVIAKVELPWHLWFTDRLAIDNVVVAMTSKKLGLRQGGHYNFLAGSIRHQICTLSVIIFNKHDAKLKIKFYLQNALRFNFLHCFMSFHMGPKFYTQFFVSLGHSWTVPFDLVNIHK